MNGLKRLLEIYKVTSFASMAPVPVDFHQALGRAVVEIAENAVGKCPGCGGQPALSENVSCADCGGCGFIPLVSLIDWHEKIKEAP